MNILAVKISSLGDILHAFPAVSMIRERFGDARIDWLAGAAFAPILKYNRDINRVILFPRSELASPASFFPSFFRLAGEMRRGKYDIVIDMQGLFRSAFFAKLAGSPRVAGFSSVKEFPAKLFYDEKIEIGPEYVHAVERNAGLVSKIFLLPFKVPEVYLPEISEYGENAQKILAENGVSKDDPLVGVSPGARWESKRWPSSFYARLIDLVSERCPDVKFLLLGSPSETEFSREILKLRGKASVADLSGKTGICELVEIIRACRAFVCNDSGPMHIAAALKTPVFAMFGPTSPEKTGPYGNAHNVFQPDLNCIKCLKRLCPRNNYMCHTSINAVSVADKIARFLRGDRT